MTTATVAEVRTHFDAFLKASEDGPVVLTRKGKPVAMLLGGKDDDEIERLLMSHSPALQSILSEASAQIEAGKGIPAEEFWAALDAKYERPARRAKPAVQGARRKKAS